MTDRPSPIILYLLAALVGGAVGLVLGWSSGLLIAFLGASGGAALGLAGMVAVVLVRGI